MDIGESQFNALFNCCPVVTYYHKGDIRGIYVRTSPIPQDFNAYKLFTSFWTKTNNLLDADFKMYSSIDDAKAKKNAWVFCNYIEDIDVDVAGFPIDCGPLGVIGDWGFFYFPNTPEQTVQWPKKTHQEGFEIYIGDCSTII